LERIRPKLKLSNQLPILELQEEFKAEEILMRIDQNTAIPATTDAGQAKAASRLPSKSVGNTEGLAGDQAELSAVQARIQTLVAQVNRLPEVRQEKVAALGQAVREGRYQVSAEQTAEAIISQAPVRSAA
jgi:negative regulator of flagellin synthesis FlgM